MSPLTTSIRCIPSVPFCHTQNPYVHFEAPIGISTPKLKTSNTATIPQVTAISNFFTVHHKALLSYVEKINENVEHKNQQKTDSDRGLKGNTANSLLATIYFDGKFDQYPYPV